MDLPIDQILPHLLRQGVVFYFIDPDIPSTEPHNYVLLTSDPNNDKDLIFVHGTSKIDRVKRLRKEEPSDSLVIITPAEYSDFTRDTIFDCNEPFITDLETLINLIKNTGRIKGRNPIPPALLVKLVRGVLASRLVAQEIKNKVSGVEK